MKKVCVYCQTWESGGIESFLNNVLQHMDLSGLQIDIVADVLKKSVFTEPLRRRGVRFFELSGSPRAVIQNYRRMAKLLREQDYDVLHLNVFQALPLAFLPLAKGNGILRRIAHSHNTMLRSSRTRPLKLGVHRLAKRLFAKDATDLWACSGAAAEFMFPSALLRKNGYRFIPNGIDLHRFRFDAAEREKVRKQLHLEQSFVIGNVGRFCVQKNQGFLLDVFAQVHAQDTSARLLLVGEGETLAELKESAEQRALSGVVIFYGTTPHVERLLWAMDVFVFPSIFEGLGIAAIEAQAAGLPVICSDSVPQEALASSLARQVPLTAPVELWAQSVLALEKTPRTGGEAEQVRAAGFDAAAAASQIEAFYRGDPNHGRA